MVKPAICIGIAFLGWKHDVTQKFIDFACCPRTFDRPHVQTSDSRFKTLHMSCPHHKCGNQLQPSSHLVPTCTATSLTHCDLRCLEFGYQLTITTGTIPIVNKAFSSHRLPSELQSAVLSLCNAPFFFFFCQTLDHDATTTISLVYPVGCRHDNPGICYRKCGEKYSYSYFCY